MPAPAKAVTGSEFAVIPEKMATMIEPVPVGPPVTVIVVLPAVHLYPTFSDNVGLVAVDLCCSQVAPAPEHVGAVVLE